MLHYALITPARDEAANLTRLSESIAAQTIQPASWIIVDNGSTDGTVDTARSFVSGQPYVQVLQIDGAARAARGGASVRAFVAGVDALDAVPDVVVNLDADVSMPSEYFECLLAAFERDERVGIASGSCLEQEDGAWREVPVASGHVRGATRAYRRQCLEDVLPLEERVGWDGIDTYKARVKGWRVATVPGISFKHHRRLGERDGRRRSAWMEQGRAAYYMGYRPLYLLLRTILRSVREPAASAMVLGYAESALARSPRIRDDDVRSAVRRDQRFTRIPGRAAEALRQLAASADRRTG